LCALARRGRVGARDEPKQRTDWPAVLYKLYQANDYGVREPLLEQADRLLREQELRALAARFEDDARRAMEDAKTGHTKPTMSSDLPVPLDCWPAHCMTRSSTSNRFWCIPRRRMPCRRTTSLSSTFSVVMVPAHCAGSMAHPRRTLTSSGSTYSTVPMGCLGDRDGQIEVRRDLYQRAPGIDSYRALEEILPIGERSEFRARACQDVKTSPSVASAAELLFALEEPALAEQLIIERSEELDGRSYVLLTAASEDGQSERSTSGGCSDLADPHRRHSRPRLRQGVWTCRALLSRASLREREHCGLSRPPFARILRGRLTARASSEGKLLGAVERGRQIDCVLD